MSLTPSLRSRVRRLEDAAAIRAEPTLTDLLREVEARRAMTPEQHQARQAAHRAACIASLSEPDAAGKLAALLQEVSRRAGRRYLAEQ